MNNIDEYLSSVYFDTKCSGSFGGAERLCLDVKEEGKFKLSQKHILDWLMKQDAYMLHKLVPQNFKTNHVIDKQWQMDFPDVQSLKEFNDCYCYLLVCIDVFSKYVRIVRIILKMGPALVKDFEVILSSGRKPEMIMTDEGTEFFNEHFEGLLNNENIQLFNMFDKMKASLVEKVNSGVILQQRKP